MTWHHVVTAYDGAGNEYLYIDGKVAWTATARTLNILKPAANNNGNLFLGAWYDTASAGSTQMTFYNGGAFLMVRDR